MIHILSMFSYGKNKKSLTSGWASHLKVNYFACMLSNQSYMMYLANRPSVLQASFYCSTIECPLFCSLYPRQRSNSVFLIAIVIGNLCHNWNTRAYYPKESAGVMHCRELLLQGTALIWNMTYWPFWLQLPEIHQTAVVVAQLVRMFAPKTKGWVYESQLR